MKLKNFINFSSKHFENFHLWVGLTSGCARGVYGARTNARAHPTREKFSFCMQEVVAIIKSIKNYHQKSVGDKFFEKISDLHFESKYDEKNQISNFFFKLAKNAQKCSMCSEMFPNVFRGFEIPLGHIMGT